MCTPFEKAGLITMQKKKPAPQLSRKAKEEPNKKLIIWVSSIFGAVIVGMSVLLILNQ